MIARRGALALAAMTAVAVACGSETASPVSTVELPPGATTAPSSTSPTVTTTLAPSTTSAAPPSTTSAPPATPSVPAVDDEVLADISMTAVPADVILPTSEVTLNPANPINGRRGDPLRDPDDLECEPGAVDACLRSTLDLLGFDVTSGTIDDRERRVHRAIAVVQLDAGVPVTGIADEELLGYLGLAADGTPEYQADEIRQIGTSADDRPILAMRHGDGPRTVLVVGQTHGDEEGGLRVALRARSLPIPDEVTMWVVPTMNPDGARLDTRFLANGADPNRLSPIHPEQQAVHDFALEIRPRLSVWYHQNYGWIGGSGTSVIPATLYHQQTALGALNRSGDCAKGFTWCPIDEALLSSSILVELPDVVTPADVHVHARALLDVAASDQY